VQIGGGDGALALRRARRASAALANYGEKYTAARLMCDFLPLMHNDDRDEIASTTATELEAIGALASAKQALSVITRS
jgi:hypothetical protein